MTPTPDVVTRAHAAVDALEPRDVNRLLGWIVGTHPEIVLDELAAMRQYDEASRPSANPARAMTWFTDEMEGE